MNEEDGELSKPTLVETFVPFAFVVTVGGVGDADVAVAGFEEFEDTAFVYYTGAAVVSEGGEEVFVFAVFLVHGAEFGVVFSEERVSLSFGQLDSSEIRFARLHLMAVANVGLIKSYG